MTKLDFGMGLTIGATFLNPERTRTIKNEINVLKLFCIK
jgi:hypothetical protein